MKKILLPYFIIIIAILGINNSLEAQIIDKKSIIDSLTRIDPNILVYFPRWKICEPDLMAQIYQGFLYKGYPADKLSKDDIQVLGGPRESLTDPFEILLISCGKCSMNTIEIESTFNDLLVGFLSGYYIYSGRQEVLNTEKMLRTGTTAIPIYPVKYRYQLLKLR